MVFSPGFFEALEKHAERQRKLEKMMTSIDSDSSVIQATVAHSERRQEIYASLDPPALRSAKIQKNLDRVVALYSPRTLAVFNSIALKNYTIPESTFQALAQQTATLDKVAVQIANNQAFFDAVEQSIALANTVDQLTWMGATYSSPYNRVSETDDGSGIVEEEILNPEVEQVAPETGIFERTADPYGPFRDDVYQTQQLLAAFLLASLMDGGELSSEMSEEQKKGVRLGLAVFVGFAVGASVGLVAGPGVGTAVGIGSSSFFSFQTDSFYDIKRHQSLPEDDEE